MGVSRGYIAQHHDQGGGAPNNARKSRIRSGPANVGNVSGGEANNRLAPAAAPDAMINTQHGAVRNENDGALRRPKR
jgi:hypothetical protein